MNTSNKILLETYMKRKLYSMLGGHPVELTGDEVTQYHPSEDVTFMERFGANAITDQERKNLLEHLNQCAFCRQEIAWLCKCGALFDEQPAQNAKPSTVKTLFQRWKAYVKPLTLVACLLIVIGIGALYSLHSVEPSQVAFNNVKKMLNSDEKNFSTSLTTNGYRLNGTSSTKAMTVVDDHKQAVRSAYKKLIADYPSDILFRVEFGKYLLFVLHEPDLAQNELEKALEASLLPPELHRVPELRLLLGIAAFEERNDMAAQEQFRHVLDLDPTNLDAKVNLAISLYRSGEKEKATGIFEQLRKESIPTPLRNRIESFLDRE